MLIWLFVSLYLCFSLILHHKHRRLFLILPQFQFLITFRFHTVLSTQFIHLVGGKRVLTFISTANHGNIGKYSNLNFRLNTRYRYIVLFNTLDYAVRFVWLTPNFLSQNKKKCIQNLFAFGVWSVLWRVFRLKRMKLAQVIFSSTLFQNAKRGFRGHL